MYLEIQYSYRNISTEQTTLDYINHVILLLTSLGSEIQCLDIHSILMCSLQCNKIT